MRDDVVVERQHADAVPLALREIRQARPDVAAVFQLRNTAAGELHRPRDVEQDRQVRVRVGFVLLHVKAIGACVQAPVDATDVVARHVAAVLGEVDRRAEERRAVQAVDEAFDDVARHELEVADAHQHLGVDELGAGDGFACTHRVIEDCGLWIADSNADSNVNSWRYLLFRIHNPQSAILNCYIPLFGTGTADSNSSMTASDVTPSDSARKLVSTRCRNTGCASARMSS